MPKKIAIGILIPSSTITPMGKDFETGVKRGLKKITENANWEVELIPEFIGPGSKEKVEAAINKLIGYDNTDIITGIVSNRSGTEVADKFEKNKKLFLINNLGEHLPNPGVFNANVFMNSTNLWQQVWSLGYWGAKTFGKTGMIVSGLYDAGYSFSAMLQSGMHAADPESKMPFAVAPIARPGDLADVQAVFEHIQQYNPDFVMAAFCGEEASLFLNEYVRTGLHKTKPLMGLPFLLQPFQAEEKIEVYTTIATNTKIEEDHVNGFAEIANNPFHQLGYESGLLIAEALQSQNVSGLRDKLSVAEVTSDRGPINININNIGNSTHVYLVKNTLSGDTEHLQRSLCKELTTTKIDSQEMQQLLKEFSSGWYNPYLGV